MGSLSLTGKTGNGTNTLGATVQVTDIEVTLTAITNPKVRQGLVVASNTKVEYAGSYGVMFDGGTGKMVVQWHAINWTHQDLQEPVNIGATDVFWALRPGVTASIKVSWV
jgi:hypothetical protein